jgi:hypothetical protein
LLRVAQLSSSGVMTADDFDRARPRRLTPSPRNIGIAAGVVKEYHRAPTGSLDYAFP